VNGRLPGAGAGQARDIVDKILTGKLDAFFAQICLLEQPWIKDDKKKVGDLVTEAIAKLGENISVARFARFAVGAESTESDGRGPLPQPSEHRSHQRGACRGRGTRRRRPPARLRTGHPQARRRGAARHRRLRLD